MSDLEEIRDVGSIEGRYEVLSLVGEGGQGDLYVAYDERTGERVAVKTQKARTVETSSAHWSAGERLAQEGDRMLKLTGIEEIPEIIASGTYRNRRCLVMEYIDGRQLRDAMAEAKPVRDAETVASVIGQLCEILHKVHEKELVHGDLKPENVIVEPDGRLRLIDMGHAVRESVRTEWASGTFGYSAPEQWVGNQKGLTGRADIFALGCVLLEMTVMRLPYGGMEERVTRHHPVLPPDRLEAIPPEFRDLALHMVRWDPEDRPADVREVFEHIRAYLPTTGSRRRPSKRLDPDATEYYRTRPPRL
ncbi:Serine/threonine-protein kinase StkP [Streptomyces sp. ADI96-02]|uniref:serine/threonine protein kinase n=1 Tax=Streptomyces sp. ADI96-02 TaxID=1522760 RepID=UPI000F54DF87|nr:serine/threonine-protein kinase [Streptomyces sp. ADI96-02]RPK56831.1 Serine/threonine-protein kinase StkP [Streptomyces sp. ADI96-02]